LLNANKVTPKTTSYITPVALLVLLFAIALATVDDYGISWDETFRWNRGETKLQYYQALLSGEFEQARNLRDRVDHYPGFFDLPLAVARQFYGGPDYWIGHLWCAGFGLLGIGGAMALAGQLGGARAAILAGLLLALYPRYWGHMFINPKDVPFAATYVWGLWALARALPAVRRNLKSAAAFGLLAGACMSVRVGGLLLFCYAGLFLGLDMLNSWRTLGVATFRRECFLNVKWLLIAGMLAGLILLLFWPSAHTNPFATTADTLSEVTQFGWQGDVLFDGERYRASELPRRYLPEMLARTAPDWWWLLALGALVFVMSNITFWRKAWLARDYLLVAFAVLFPIAFILVKGSTVYDGARHVLFIIPALAALLGALSIKFGESLFAKLGVWPTGAWVASAALLAVVAAWDMARLHPYQYVYYNRLSGGLAGAEGRFETDYWGTAFREAAEVLAAYLPEQQRPWRITMEPPLNVLVERYGKPVIPPPKLVEPFLGEQIILVRSDGKPAPDFYIASTRNDYNQLRSGESLVEVRRDGVLLLEVKTFAPQGATKNWNSD